MDKKADVEKGFPKLSHMQIVAATTMLFCATIALFGRGSLPIVQGSIGILCVLEGHHACNERSKRRVYAYMCFHIVNSLCSIGFGVLLLYQHTFGQLGCKGPACFTSQCIQSCETTLVILGQMYLVYGAAFGIVFTVVVYYYYKKVPEYNNEDESLGFVVPTWD